MASQETGHAKNVANFEDLISFSLVTAQATIHPKIQSNFPHSVHYTPKLM